MRRLIGSVRELTVGVTGSTLGHWTLDGATTGDEVSNYALAAYNTPGTRAAPWDSSLTTRAADFNGTNQWFQVASDATMRARFKANYTLQAWFSPDAIAGTQGIFYCGGSEASETGLNNIQSYLYLDSSGYLTLMWESGSGGTDITLTSDVTCSAGGNYQVAVVVGGDENSLSCDVGLYIYDLDNKTLSSKTATKNRTTTTTSATLYIGRSNAGNYFNGAIADVRVLNVPQFEGGVRADILNYVSDWDEEYLYSSGVYTTHMRVWIKDTQGNWRNLSDLGGNDFLDSVSIKDDVDALSSTANIQLYREFFDWSLAPERTDSVLNQDTGGGYYPLIQVASQVRVEVAITPMGESPSEIEWIHHWDGVITNLDFGSEIISIDCKDRNAILDAWIESPKRWGGSGDLVTIWVDGGDLTVSNMDGHQFSTGDTVVIEGTTNYNGTYTVDAGTSATEVLLGSFTDYGLQDGIASAPVEQEIAKIIDDSEPSTGYLVEKPILMVSGSPDWSINGFLPDRQALSSLFDGLAMQQGWNCRFKWSDATQRDELQYYQMDRNILCTLSHSSDDILSVNQASISLDPIRNYIQVGYENREGTPNSDGSYPLVTVTASNSTSISTYGRRYARALNLPNIDRQDEALALATALSADLAQPEILGSIEVPFRRVVELGDKYSFDIERLWDLPKEMVVMGYEHRWAGGVSSTVLNLRGEVASRFRGWFSRLIPPGRADRPIVTVPAPAKASATAEAHAIKVKWQPQFKKHPIAYVEVHYSTSSGFTPSSSTLFTEVKNPDHTCKITGLAGNTIYYVKLIAVDTNGNRSSATSQLGVTTKFANSIASFAADDTSTRAESGALQYDLECTNELFDTASSYNTGTFVFTAPRDGYYSFEAICEHDHAGNQSYLFIVIKNGGTTEDYTVVTQYNSGGAYSQINKSTVYMASGWTAKAYIYVASTAAFNITNQRFSGNIVGE